MARADADPKEVRAQVVGVLGVSAGRRHLLQLEGKTVTSEERTFTNFEELDLDWPRSGF